MHVINATHFDENHSTDCCCGRMPDEIPKGPCPVLPLDRLSAEWYSEEVYCFVKHRCQAAAKRASLYKLVILSKVGANKLRYTNE